MANLVTARHTYKLRTYEDLDTIEQYLHEQIKQYNLNIEYNNLTDNKNNLPINITSEIINQIAVGIWEIEEIYLKKKNIEKKKQYFIDTDAIQCIVSFITMINEYYSYINKFRRSEKNDFQPLNTYLNCLSRIIETSTNNTLLQETEKEFNHISNLQELHCKYNKEHELYNILTEHNKLVESSNDRLPISGGVPTKELNRRTIKKLSNLIEKQFS